MSYAETLWGEGLSATFEDVARDGLLKMGLDGEDAEKFAPWAAMAPEFLPLVGAGVGIDNIGRAAADGRYMDAAKEAGLMVLGEALPIVGDMAVKKIRGSDNLWGDPTVSNITAKDAAEGARVKEVRRNAEGDRYKGERSGSGNTGNLKSMSPARQEAMLKTSPGKTREAIARENNYETVVQDTYDLNQLPVVTSKDLEGAAFIPLRGDPTAAGTLLQTSGVPIKPLKLQSGPHYGLESAIEMGDNNAAWESTEKVARDYLNKANKTAKDHGTDNIWGVYDMMDLKSSNFSTMPAEAIIREMDVIRQAGGKYPVAMVNKIDDAVRTTKKGKFEDFPGILHPDAEKYLARTGFQDARKAITELLETAGYRDAGFPNAHQVYRDVAVPDLIDNPMGTNGQMLVKLDPYGSVDFDSTHRSYGTRIPIYKPGNDDTVIGRLARTAEHEDLYHDLHAGYDNFLTQGKGPPRPMSRTERMNTTAWNGPTGKKGKGYQSLEQRMESLWDLGLILE